MALACRWAWFASTAVVCTVASEAHAQTRFFNIPAQPAESGIRAFGLQGAIQIIASRSSTRGKRTRAVHGKMQVEAALKLLLDESGLVAQRTGPQTFVVRAAERPFSPPALATGGCPDAVKDCRRGKRSTSAASKGDAGTTGTTRDVVVTARREAIETASMLKRESDTLIDAVVADEAGKLPDNSLTEVLQRIPGVTITRFASVGDPDHYSAEGFGIQVRGLSGVAARLNGREIFSSGSGRGLSWADITPELMSSVVVYKAPTADLIRGGTGGQLDLRTKMPFDYDGFALQGSVGQDYGDLSRKARLGGSLFIADRFETPWGDLGIVADLARSKYTQRTNFIRAEPYYKTRVAGIDRYIPAGYDYGEDNYSRTRTGFYGAVQWAPSDDLELDAVYFDSRYSDSLIGPIAFVQSLTLSVDPATSMFDANGGLLKSSSVFAYDPATFLPTGARLAAGGSTNYARGRSRTRDLSLPVSWRPSAQLNISGAYQDVRSSATGRSYALFSAESFPIPFGLDLTGKLPEVSFPQGGTVSLNPGDYFWVASMDHLLHNSGHQRAANLDIDYSWSDHAFFRGMKVGARYSDRAERDGDSPYNWQAFGQTWNGLAPTAFASSDPRDYSEFAFRDFFRGDANLPARLLLPSVEAVQRFDPVGDHQKYGFPITPAALTPGTISNVQTRSLETYGLVRFADDSGIFGVPVEGNVGVRLVSGRNRSSGFFQEYAAIFFRDGVLQELAERMVPRMGTRSYTLLLPALNAQILPRPDLHLRLAYSETMDDPRYDALRAGGSLAAAVASVSIDMPGTFDGFLATLGNPRLNPVTSHNLELAVEWYPRSGTAFHASAFHKTVRNALVYGAITQDVPVLYADGTTRIERVTSNNYVNASRPARIEGIELGGRTFLDELPGVLGGLGLQADYTFIDSRNPGDTYRDINGVVHNDVPFEGLSRHNLNLVGMYERGALSARVAYSWRSRYLLYTNASGTSGSYNYYAPGATPQLIDISLPVFSEPYGQLDAGVTLRLDKHIALSLQGSNLLNSVAKTSMGGYVNGARYIRSWFIADRRLRASIDLSF